MKTRSLAHLVEHLRTLSSADLLRQTETLAKQEQLQAARLIAHLAQVASRRLHLELGYRSLFEYCTGHLGLTEGCTALRIQVSRVCGRHPQILDALATGQISLTVAGKLAPHLETGNCERLIADCKGMTKRQVEEYLVHLVPKPKVSPGTRQRSAGSPSRSPWSSSGKAGSIEPCQPGIYNLRFAADKAFMDKLQRAAEVSGLGDAGRNMVRVLERALDAYLQKNDPRKRQERREKRSARRALAEAEAGAEAQVEAGTAPAEAVACDDARLPKAGSRAIPTAVRDRLLIRAGHRCEYRGGDGRRCSERSRLEIDHVVPWGLGGTSRQENLRVLCSAHNLLHAERCFSAEFMDHKIESARSMSARGRPSGSQPPRPDEVTREPAAIYRAGRRLNCAGSRLPMSNAMVLANRVRWPLECPGGFVGHGQP